MSKILATRPDEILYESRQIVDLAGCIDVCDVMHAIEMSNLSAECPIDTDALFDRIFPFAMTIDEVIVEVKKVVYIKNTEALGTTKVRKFR